MTPLFLFVIAKGRGYYLVPAYPMLYAAGSVWLVGNLDSMRIGWARFWRTIAWVALIANLVAVQRDLPPPCARQFASREICDEYQW